MSCHNIGYGLSRVVEEIIDLHEENRIGREEAFLLISTAADSVHYCDGNEYEVTDTIRKRCCGKCLRHMTAGEYLYSTMEVQDTRWNKKNLFCKVHAVHDMLCQECFDEELTTLLGDPQIAPAEREQMIKDGTALVVPERRS